MPIKCMCKQLCASGVSSLRHFSKATKTWLNYFALENLLFWFGSSAPTRNGFRVRGVHSQHTEGSINCLIFGSTMSSSSTPRLCAPPSSSSSSLCENFVNNLLQNSKRNRINFNFIPLCKYLMNIAFNSSMCSVQTHTPLSLSSLGCCVDYRSSASVPVAPDLE